MRQASFRSEVDLVEAALGSPRLLDALRPLHSPLVLTETRGLFGVPDAVFTNLEIENGRWICGTTIAFEMKLRNWRRALIQAFRYRSFAHASYVVLDAAHARPAVREVERFRRSKVGLITISLGGAVEFVFTPPPDQPVCRRMEERFIKAVHMHVDAM